MTDRYARATATRWSRRQRRRKKKIEQKRKREKETLISDIRQRCLPPTRESMPHLASIGNFRLTSYFHLEGRHRTSFFFTISTRCEFIIISFFSLFSWMMSTWRRLTGCNWVVGRIGPESRSTAEWSRPVSTRKGKQPLRVSAVSASVGLSLNFFFIFYYWPSGSAIDIRRRKMQCLVYLKLTILGSREPIRVHNVNVCVLPGKILVEEIFQNNCGWARRHNRFLRFFFSLLLLLLLVVRAP